MSEFIYDPNLGLTENIQNLGLAHSIRVGLDYVIEKDVPHGVKSIGGMKFLTLEAPVAGELLLRQIGSRHLEALGSEQRQFLISKATEVYELGKESEVFEDFNAAYEAMLSGQLPKAAENDPALLMRCQQIYAESSEWSYRLQETTKEVADLMLLHFLAQRSLDPEVEWTFKRLYSLSEPVKKELKAFLDEVLALNVADDVPTDDDEEEKESGGK